MRRSLAQLGFALLSLAATAQAGTIEVRTGIFNTCSLEQAINLANSANPNASYTMYISPAGTGFCIGATAGANTIVLPPFTLVYATADNNWYGPNALPPIQSVITIEGAAAGGSVIDGFPTPGTAATAFRFFYVSGGLIGELPPGDLTLHHLTVQNGMARGGDSARGGGGAGLGGAIFNQGHLLLSAVTLVGNAALGGNTNLAAGTVRAGGGMGADAQVHHGGGFGGSWAGGYGGNGGDTGTNGAGGGGGFLSSSNGAAGTTVGGAGGGLGALGGRGAQSGGAAGDGGGGGGSFVTIGAGAAFGFGGTYVGGGFGPGGGAGGGGEGGGGGGFGGGGGGGGPGGGGGGGFGGGGGGTFSGLSCGAENGVGGFGAGHGGASGCNIIDDTWRGGGGAGMGGAIFNHRGQVQLINVTASNNRAVGGYGAGANATNGSGLGGALFNLNGAVDISFSTLFANAVSSSNGVEDMGAGNGTVYSVALGNKIENGKASTATLTLRGSIVYGTTCSNSAGCTDVVNAKYDGAQTNSAALEDGGSNLIGATSDLTGATVIPASADPLLDVLANNGGPTQTMALLPASPAFHGATNCSVADGVDQRGLYRPLTSRCDIGAYEDTFFFDGFESP